MREILIIPILLLSGAAGNVAVTAGDVSPGSPCPRPEYLVIHDGAAFRKVEGRLIAKGPNNRVEPVTAARFFYASTVGSSAGTGLEVEIDSNGNFRVTVAIPWWKHDYCENGLIVSKEGTGREKVLVRAKGCEDYIFSVGDDWAKRDVELSCKK